MSKNKFYFNGELWNSMKCSTQDINEHLNKFLKAPEGEWYAKADVELGQGKVVVKIQRHYVKYNVPKDADWIWPEDASILLGYWVPAPFRDRMNIMYKIAEVERMFAEEKKGKLKILSQDEDVLVVEIEMV